MHSLPFSSLRRRTLSPFPSLRLFIYNDFGQLTADYQEHSGEVNTSTTPKVQYGYADGTSNTIRQLTLTYPNGRVLTYGYGAGDGINDAISRIASLIDNDVSATHLADYSFVGQGQFVVVDYTEPDVKYTLVNLAGSNDPDTGDIYSGWDRFGRVKDCRWYDYGHSTDTARLKYGYDRASNRLWREDTVAQSLGKNFDELYSYDGLNRLKDMQRGLLNSGHTSISSETFAQCWSLDSTNNWHGFKEASSGGAWTTVQSRTANAVNEITGISNTVGSSWVTPAYDAAGNTTTIQQPTDPTKSYTGTYDAWNRLVTLVNDTTSNTVQETQYDARNFRVIRSNYTTGSLSETRHYYYTSRWQGIEERTDTSNLAERQHVWGQRYIDDLVLRDRDSDDNNSLNERLFGVQDANWDTIVLIDASAAAQERYLYSPFGWPTLLTGVMTFRGSSAVDNEVLFTGQKFDASAKLHLFRNRWIDPIGGRFLSRDPLKYPDGSNAYAAWFVPFSTDSSVMVTDDDLYFRHHTKHDNDTGCCTFDPKTVKNHPWTNAKCSRRGRYAETIANYSPLNKCTCSWRLQHIKWSCPLDFCPSCTLGYRLSCTKPTLTTQITLDKALIDHDGVSQKGKYGHEQRHVLVARTLAENATAVLKKAEGWYSTYAQCYDAANKAEHEADRKFIREWDNESLHENSGNDGSPFDMKDYEPLDRSMPSQPK